MLARNSLLARLARSVAAQGLFHRQVLLLVEELLFVSFDGSDGRLAVSDPQRLLFCFVMSHAREEFPVFAEARRAANAKWPHTRNSGAAC